MASKGIRSVSGLVRRSVARPRISVNDLPPMVSQHQPLQSFASSSRLRLDSNPHSASSSSSSASSSSAHSSIHASEIEHFSKLSSKWWDEHGEFGLLHAMNPARIQFMREKLEEVWGYETAQAQVEARQRQQGTLSVSSSTTISSSTTASSSSVGNLGKVRFLEGLEVADIGCGGGLLSESLARLGARTTGVDASASNIGIAKTHAARDPFLCQDYPTTGAAADEARGQTKRLTYLHTTAEDLVSQGRQFDVVCAMEVLEHVNGPAEFLRSLDSLVKPGGHLFMSTIARTPLSWFLTIFMAEDVLRLVTPGTHTHHQYINPQELIDFFNKDRKWFQHGANTTLPQRLHFETRGTMYLPWKGQWILTQPQSKWPGTQECNYFFWARKPKTPLPN